MRANKRLGFSLMEMMVVLLIVAIIAAASAPLVTKKLTRNGTNESPWQFVGLNNDIAYNTNGQDATAIIGAGQARGNNKPRLYIQTENNQPAISFGSSDPQISNNILNLYAYKTKDSDNQDSYAIGIKRGALTLSPGAIGLGGEARNTEYSIAIGNSANAGFSKETIAIGRSPSVRGEKSIAIGTNTFINNAENSIAIGSSQILAGGDDSVLIGDNAYLGSNTWPYSEDKTPTNSIAIGANAGVLPSTSIIGSNLIAIGNSAIAASAGAYNDDDFPSQYLGGAIAIGAGAFSGDAGTIAIGNHATTSDNSEGSYNGDYAISIGHYAETTKPNAIAFGHSAKAFHENSIAIGYKAQTSTDNQIVLGTSDSTVYIPGRLVVGGATWLNIHHDGASPNGNNGIWLGASSSNDISGWLYDYETNSGHEVIRALAITNNSQNSGLDSSYFSSDRRLKNVGEKYTAGLEELKKLDFFHYTFKKDENKTPRVGVMAQDLQKVFPDAVVKGKDGYLMIRTEDMFYAVINAVKELDSKISALVEKVDSIVEDITMMKATIEAQQKTIDELKAQNEEIIKTNEKIMKRLEKLEKKKLSKVEE